jgi:hypothetical protein
MSWQSWRIPDKVWTQGGLRHRVDQWTHDEDVVQWQTACGIYTSGAPTAQPIKPRFHKGFVTCLQCLAKGDGDP